MSNKDNGGPAFPTETFMTDGMTLRDYFAAKAMQGLLARNAGGEGVVHEKAYQIADAMLKERAK